MAAGMFGQAFTTRAKSGDSRLRSAKTPGSLAGSAAEGDEGNELASAEVGVAAQS
jgi:hypothetical protein